MNWHHRHAAHPRWEDRTGLIMLFRPGPYSHSRRVSVGGIRPHWFPASASQSWGLVAHTFERPRHGMQPFLVRLGALRWDRTTHMRHCVGPKTWMGSRPRAPSCMTLEKRRWRAIRRSVTPICIALGLAPQTTSWTRSLGSVARIGLRQARPRCAFCFARSADSASKMTAPSASRRIARLGQNSCLCVARQGPGSWCAPSDEGDQECPRYATTSGG